MLQARWVAALLSGAAQLGSEAEMLADCEAWDQEVASNGFPVRCNAGPAGVTCWCPAQAALTLHTPESGWTMRLVRSAAAVCSKCSRGVMLAVLLRWGPCRHFDHANGAP